MGQIPVGSEKNVMNSESPLNAKAVGIKGERKEDSESKHETEDIVLRCERGFYTVRLQEGAQPILTIATGDRLQVCKSMSFTNADAAVRTQTQNQILSSYITVICSDHIRCSFRCFRLFKNKRYCGHHVPSPKC